VPESAFTAGSEVAFVRVILVWGVHAGFPSLAADCWPKAEDETLAIAANTAAALFETRILSARNPIGQSLVRTVPSARRNSLAHSLPSVEAINASASLGYSSEML